MPDGISLNGGDNSKDAPSYLFKRSGSEKRQRGIPVSVRLLPEERALLEERAGNVGLSLAAFLRVAALGVPGPRARRKPHVNAEILARAIAALNKVGGLLNQIARVLNAGGAITLAGECYTALGEIRAAARAIREAVGRKDHDDNQGEPA